MPNHLVGDFMVAAWDRPAGALFVARDHMGVRPVYVARATGGAIVSTGLDEVAATHGVDLSVDSSRVAEVLVDWWHDHRSTFYRGIRRLPGGHRAWVRPDGSIRAERYWVLSRDELRLRDDRAYEDRFRELFVEAVRSRMPADGDVAAELSGGLDSATVAGALAKEVAPAGRRLFTFAGSFSDLRYEDGALDEARYRSWIGTLAGVRATEVQACDALSADAVARSIEANHGPIAGSMILLRQHLYEQAREQQSVTTIFDGQDGDTVVGYGHERLTRLITRAHLATFAHEVNAIRRLRGPKRAAWAAFAFTALAPASWAAWHLGRRPRGIRESLASKELLRATSTWERIRPVGVVRPDDVRGSHIHDVGAAYNAFSLEVTAALARRAGLRARHPLYDPRIVELAVSLPDDQLLRDGVARSIQRRALDGIAPPEVLWRTDKGALPEGFVSDALVACGIHETAAADGGAAAPYIDVNGLRRTYRRWSETQEGSLAAALYPVALLDRWLSRPAAQGSGYSHR